MSTKIHQAYRVPLEKLHKFEKETTPEIVKKAASTIKDILEVLDPQNFAKWIKERNGLYPEKGYDKEACVRYVSLKGLKYLETTREDEEFPEIYEFYFEHGWKMFLDEYFAYLIPYGSAINSVSIPDYAEDYKYWNNVDKAEDISRGEWNERGNKWDELLERNVHGSPFKIPAVSFSAENDRLDSIRSIQKELIDTLDEDSCYEFVQEVVKNIKE